MVKDKSRIRHIAKTITWRAVGTIDTIIIAWLVSGDLSIGATIGGIEVVTKMILYYLHERTWYKTRIFISKSSQTRHILKTITWRLIGTMDTMFMGWLISGDATIGLTIGAFELITKMVLYYVHERIWHRSTLGLSNVESAEVEQDKQPKSENIFVQDYAINRQRRNELNGHKSFMVLFTGLSGSGKSTLANQVEKQLSLSNIKTYLLDGDNVRFGLNKDLGFSEEDRHENLRRIGETSKLFVDSGTVVLAAFVSPLHKDRALIKNIVGEHDYIEVFVSTPLEECEKRDVKGLYAKARKGEIPNFTGINSPYEAPLNPTIEVNTALFTLEECTNQVFNKIKDLIE